MLSDVRVVDLLDGMGAYASRLLIGLGAEVVKVEPPGGSPQRDRAWADPPAAPGVEQLEFLHYYVGAKSVTVDPESDVGRRQLEALLQSAEIVLDNGQLARWGFDLDALADEGHPRVIVSVTPFGLDGPRSHWLGTDMVCQAMSGMLGLFGYYDERPARFGPEQASQMAGLAAASGALIALFGARHGAGGEVVDIAVERVCAMSTFQMWNASIAEQFGFRRDRVARTEGLPSGVYEAADGYMAINPWREPDRMLAFLQQEGVAGNLRKLRAEVGDVEFPGRPEADVPVRQVFQRYTKVELLEKLQAAALIGLPVNDASDLLADPFLLQRDYFTDVVAPEGHALRDAGPPVRFSRTPYESASTLPALGEHNREILGPDVASDPAVPGQGSRWEGRLMPGPLQGIRVVDLSWIIAGPLVSRLMADFGAEVVKVESTRRMDIARANRTPLYGVLPGDANSNPDTGGYFQDANAHKKSCTLNLETVEGRELLKRLISVSDVAICNLAGDMYERWGIGYEAAKELNPGIILVNIPSMESAGPRKNWRGFGDMFVGMGGLKSTSGHPDDPPLPWGHQYADFASNPLHALAAIMAALLERDRSGEGQFIEVSQYESTVALMGPALLDYSLTGEVRARAGNRSADACPHNFYRCAGEDSWCAIAVQSDEQWRRLVEFAGVEELAQPAYATLEGRKRSEEEIDAALETWTSRWDRQELAEALQGRGIPAGPYQKIDEMVHRDPTLSERHWARLPHPVGRDFLVFRNPIETRRNPPTVALGPLIGQHTFEVLTEVIGLTEDEIAEYAAAGAIG